MEFVKHLDIVINWGQHNRISGGILETLRAMQNCGHDELHRDEHRACRAVQQALAESATLESTIAWLAQREVEETIHAEFG